MAVSHSAQAAARELLKVKLGVESDWGRLTPTPHTTLTFRAPPPAALSGKGLRALKRPLVPRKVLSPQYRKSATVSTARRPKGLQQPEGTPAANRERGEGSSPFPISDFRSPSSPSAPQTAGPSGHATPHSATGHSPFPTAVLLTLRPLPLRGGSRCPRGLPGGQGRSSNAQRPQSTPLSSALELAGLRVSFHLHPRALVSHPPACHSGKFTGAQKALQGAIWPHIRGFSRHPGTPDPCPSQKEGRLESARSEPGWKTLLQRVLTGARGPK